jgi:hypothetical protein
MFLRWRGFNIDSGLFGISLCEPQNFASYRQSELDTTRISAFMQLEQLPYLSKRFMMQRFLGLSEEEILENEQMWREEKDEPELNSAASEQMRSVGIMPGSIEQDIATGQELAGAEMGADSGAPEGSASPATPTAGVAGAPPVPTI